MSAAYDLSTLGAGKYTIRPRANLYVVHSSGNIETISADTEDHVAKMAANSAKYSPRSTAKLSLLKKRSQEINFRGCTADQQSIVRVAAPNAVKMIRESSRCVGLLVLRRHAHVCTVATSGALLRAPLGIPPGSVHTPVVGKISLRATFPKSETVPCP